MHDVGVIGSPHSGAEPHIPIEFWRRRPLLESATRIVVLVPHFDVILFAEFAIANELSRRPSQRMRTALRPNLHDAGITLPRLHHLLAFADGATGRLLRIDILARLTRINGH